MFIISLLLQLLSAEILALPTAEAVFTHIFNQGIWKEKQRESDSGKGSTFKNTVNIRAQLPLLLKELAIKSIVDAPCGDFNWMRNIDLTSYNYIGIDIVKTLIERNQKLYGNEVRTFIHLNVIEESNPKVDAILCRDLLPHLPFKDIFKVLKNFKNSGSKYLLTTTYRISSSHKNKDIKIGDWRRIDLEKPPFNFPKPLQVIKENEEYKYLGIWLLDDIVTN